MSNGAIGALIFLLMFVMVLFGIPIFVSMIFCSLLGFIIIGGPTIMINQLTSAPFSLAASYSYAVLPLFTLVGMLAGETGIARGAYDAAKIWLERMRGGLLYTTIVANAIFGACSGINTAGNIIFSKIALPELDRNGYDRRTSLGCIVSSSCLSVLIPPSIPIIMYCLLAGYSIGRTLMCGLSTGILTVIVMFIGVKVIGIITPDRIPKIDKNAPRTPMKKKVASLKLIIPIVILFALIIGGTYAGWFSATVAGAIGAVACVIYAFCKRISPKRIFLSAWEGGHIFAGIYPIIIAGTMFSRFVSYSGLAQFIINALTSLPLPPIGIYLMVIVYFIFCGAVMDIMCTIIISVPIVFPLLVDTLGYDPYALIIVLCLMSSIASITPPIGMGVFTVSNATGIPSKEIFKGVVPYLIMLLIVTILIVIFPQIPNLIPNISALFSS